MRGVVVALPALAAATAAALAFGGRVLVVADPLPVRADPAARRRDVPGAHATEPDHLHTHAGRQDGGHPPAVALRFVLRPALVAGPPRREDRAVRMGTPRPLLARRALDDPSVRRPPAGARPSTACVSTGQRVPETQRMTTPEDIQRALEAALPGARVSVEDTTGGGDHFEVEVAAAAFAGKTLVEQHQLV